MTTTRQFRRLEMLECMKEAHAKPNDDGRKVLEFLWEKADKLIQSGHGLAHDPAQSPVHNIAAAIAREDYQAAKALFRKAVQSMNEKVRA